MTDIKFPLSCKTSGETVSDHFVDVNKMIELLGKSGIKPENLPAEEDIKKLERRVKSGNKEIASKRLNPHNKKND